MSRVHRRGALGLLAVGASAAAVRTLWPDGAPDAPATVTAQLPSPTPPPGPSPIELENRAPGTTAWPPRDDQPAVDDRHRQIQGYASATSVSPGDPIDFHVAVDEPQSFRITVLRLGWYGGAGAREVLTSPPLAGVPQPVPKADRRTGTIACHWPVSWTLRVPDDWTSGLYEAVFTSAAGLRASTPFVVRDDRRRGGLCVVLPFTTYQAYNQWPADGRTGTSLYYGFDTGGRLDYDVRALEVSFDRPYSGDGRPKHLDRDHDFVQWVERNGHDVSYATSLDLHSGRLDPTRHRGLVFSGHDEYWSMRMRRAAEQVVAAGGSLAFLAANSVYWHVRLAPAADGRPDRVLACWKTSPDRAADAAGPTTFWRSVRPDHGLAEQALLGVQYNGIVADPHPLVVRAADHWFWAGTGVVDGDRIPGLVAGEADGFVAGHPRPTAVTATALSSSPYRTRYGTTRTQTSHLYETPQGGVVFAAGTLAWSMALNRPGHRDERVERVTANLLDRMTRRP